AKDAKLTKAQAKDALDSFVKSTTTALKKGDRVALVGFGSFSVAKRNARTGRNPQTGKEITIPAKKVVRFKAGSELSDTVK
ncbi:MAG: DNA-binding protein, partial [Marinilabiliales bacterium]